MEQYRWDGTLKNDGFNETTYYMLFRDFHYLKEESNREEIYKIYRNICDFTISPRKGILDVILKFKDQEENKIKKNEFNKYVYSNDNYEIAFSLLSQFVKNKREKKELESYRRFGKCHLMSLYLVSHIPNTWVLTGYITIKQSKYLHSVVEIEKDGKILILDWTKNLIISKEDYVTLTKFHEISRINNKDVSNELQTLLDNNLSLKAYTLFRNEIMEALKKNSFMFKESEKIKKKVY